jgi:hypothetical protein
MVMVKRAFTTLSIEEEEVQQTQHAFLVAWGWFGEHSGLIQAIEKVHLDQKSYIHTPQTKVLEFLVGILAGLKHLQEISQSAHPLDLDQAVAEAWGQGDWADYTGVSRTLSALSWEEVRHLVQALEEVSQPFLQAELSLIRSRRKRLQYDGDLIGIPVSSTSQTYPNAAYGHMDDEIRLGYQAGIVSLVSESYGRLWLSTTHLPGGTVSCTQAEALVLAAEAKTGLRPQRRTDLLGQRIQTFETQVSGTQQRTLVQQTAVQKAQERLTEACQEAQERQKALEGLEHEYQMHQRKERPTSQLALARQRWEAIEHRQQRWTKACQTTQRRLEKTQALCMQQQAELKLLKDRLARFEQENTSNGQPVEAEFRLDAGFGTYDNIALLIEMGYEVYTKAHNHRLVTFLKKRTNPSTIWERVGANAEMVAWKNVTLKHCPYPLDIGLERFYTGQTLKHSALLHFGADPVTQNLPDWFKHYNGRQIIEAGIKESKQVFYLHKIKVRSEPAIYLQESFVIFAANFIRWATSWLASQSSPTAEDLQVAKLGVKRQVHVGAHVSAQVIQNSNGKLLKFSEHSAFSGKVLKFPGGISPQSFL